MKLTLFIVLTLILVIGAACSPEAPIVDPAVLETVGAVTQLVPSEATVPASTATALPAATETQPADAATQLPATTAASTPTISPQPDLVGLPQVDQAKADLAARLGVAGADIEVVSVETVTWPNGALGCPQPGMAYADVLVEGLLVKLSHGGQVYNYHSGESGAPFLCKQGTVVEKSTPIFGDDLLTPAEPDY